MPSHQDYCGRQTPTWILTIGIGKCPNNVPVKTANCALLKQFLIIVTIIFCFRLSAQEIETAIVVKYVISERPTFVDHLSQESLHFGFDNLGNRGDRDNKTSYFE